MLGRCALSLGESVALTEAATAAAAVVRCLLAHTHNLPLFVQQAGTRQQQHNRTASPQTHG